LLTNDRGLAPPAHVPAISFFFSVIDDPVLTNETTWSFSSDHAFLIIISVQAEHSVFSHVRIAHDLQTGTASRLGSWYKYEGNIVHQRMKEYTISFKVAYVLHEN
jgi:hypothetical protein